MTEFAQLDESGVVVQVIVADQTFIDTGSVGDPASWHLVRQGTVGIGYALDVKLGIYVPPGGLSAELARFSLLSAIAAVETRALADYSEGERQSWATQMREAAGFLGMTQAQLLAGDTGTPGTDLSLAPFLVGSCAIEYGAASNEDRLIQLNELALSVAANAKRFSDLSQILVGVRRGGFVAINAAEDEEGRRAAVLAALQALSQIGG